MPHVPLPVIPNIWRTSLNWQDADSGHIAKNVMNFHAPGGSTALQVFTALDAHVTQAMWDWAAGSAQVLSVDLLPLDGVSGTQSFLTGAPAKWTGGGGGQSIPQVAGLLKFSTGLRGAANRGRIFIPFVGEGEQDGGRLIDIAAVQTAWNAAQVAWATDATTPLILQVTSYKHAVSHFVQSILAEATTATQRRRQRRR